MRPTKSETDGMWKARILEAVSAHTTTHLAYLDRNLDFVWVNPTYAARCGHSPEELIGRSHFHFFPDAENQAIFERVRDTGEPYEATEKPFVYADHPEWGVSYWDWTLTPVKDAEGQVEGLAFSLLEVTGAVNARQEIEALREAAEEKARELNAVFAALADALLVFDTKGDIIQANETTRRVYGFDPVGQRRDKVLNSLRICRPDGQAVPLEELPSSRALRGETVISERYYLTNANGQRITSLASAAPLMSGREVTGAVTILHDITELEQAEQALRLTQFSIDHAVDEVLWVGEDARVLYVNDATCQALGYSREELLKMTVHDLDPDFSAEVWPAHWTELEQKKAMSFESRHRAKDGRIFPVDISIIYLDFGGRKINCAFVRDISARKQIEQELEAAYRHEQRIATVLQNALISEVKLDVPGYEIAGSYQPAIAEAKVGGDFYDVFQLSDGRVALILGDVAGKGIEAAVYTAMCKNILRGFALEMPSPAITLERLDNALRETLPPTEFITLAYALLDPENGDIRYASGGHEPAILYRADTNSAGDIDAPGHALGCASPAEFNEISFTLGEGDMLVMYTDGISDAGRPRNCYGAMGIGLEVVKHRGENLKDLITRIMTDSAKRDRGQRSDDKALLIVRRSAEVVLDYEV